MAERRDVVEFLAVMNGPGARVITVPLSFLSTDRYQGALVRDDSPDGSTVRVDSTVHSQKDTIRIELRAGGGFLARFAPVSQ